MTSTTEAEAPTVALNRLLGQPTFGEWQPIETAPTSGMLLLLVPLRYKDKGYGSALPMPGYFQPRETAGFWVIVNHDSAIARVEPTHWMPLLPMPNAS